MTTVLIGISVALGALVVLLLTLLIVRWRSDNSTDERVAECQRRAVSGPAQRHALAAVVRPTEVHEQAIQSGIEDVQRHYCPGPECGRGG